MKDDDPSWLQGHTKDRTPADWRNDALARDVGEAPSRKPSSLRRFGGRISARVSALVRVATRR